MNNKLTLSLLLTFSVLVSAQGNNKPELNPASPERGQFKSQQLTVAQDFISVKGKKFVDESGQTFIFRGLNIADPDKIARQQQWNKKLFEVIKNWGANTVRIPIHPKAWRKRGQAEYFELLDQAVIWANEHNLYLIFDWHSIGYLETGHYQHEMYITDKQETFRFWHDIAYRYQNIPTIAVYEFFNEPTTLKEPWGKNEWLSWRNTNEQLVDTVYALDKKVIPLVAGFNWAYDLSYVLKYPVRRKGIAYASHPYPQKQNKNEFIPKDHYKKWDKSWGHVSKRYPLILTELGWVQADGYGAHVPVKNDGSYGPYIAKYMDKKKLSWTAWVFDPNWSPTMINNWSFEPSEQGEFWKSKMIAAQNSDKN